MRNAPRRVIAIVAAVVTTLGLVPAAAFADPTIDHDPVQCIVAGSYPEFIANFSPSAEVASARLYFKASDTPDWYWVPFNTESAGGWKAVLPKPSPSLRQIDYYLSVFDPQNRPSNGNQYHPVVSTRTYCENQALTVAQPVDLEGIELAVGLVRVAQQVIPSGFFSEGIATTILADGTAVATTTAAQSSATVAAGSTSSGSAAGAAGSSAAAGGGIGTTAWVLGGIALAGGAAYGLSSSGDDSGGTSSTNPPPAPGPQPQTGDVSFRLTWSGAADLDLYVQEPNGTRLYYGSPTSATGGRLDVDSNAACRSVATSPTENIFWPTGRAPRGTYRFWVNYFSRCGDTSPKSFTLRVYRGSSVAQTINGSVNANQNTSTYTYVY